MRAESIAIIVCCAAVIACSKSSSPDAASVPGAAPVAGGAATSRLLDPSVSSEIAPDTFRVLFETSRGPFLVEAHRAWSPWGVDRFHYLVRNGFYDGTRFFRVIDGFMAQFGLNGDPKISRSWLERIIPDDTVPKQANLRGRVSFGTRGPNTRTTQLFINFRDNHSLDGSFAPIAEIIDGMSVVDSLWKGYGEGPPDGSGPEQARITSDGNEYLEKEFPKLDFIKTARIVK